MDILELTLSGTIFILAVTVLRQLALRRLPKGTFVALWWAATLRLLIPVALPSPFSVYTMLAALRPQAPLAPASAPASPPLVRTFPLPAMVPAAPPSRPFPVWTALWLAVGALLSLWFLIRFVRWRRRFRESLPVDCSDLKNWLRLRRKVQVRISGQIAAPLTYGLVRPVILLPGTLDLDDEEAVSCVLAHEAVHIRRLDGLLKLVLAVALCVHWFNPAVWLLYVLANRDMELRCDESAVLALGLDSRKRYALTLLRLAEQQSMPLCGFSRKDGMEERIQEIMSVKKKSMLACAAALALMLGITTAFATSAKPPEAILSGDKDPTDAEYAAQISAEVAAQWDGILAPYVPLGLHYAFEDPDLDGNGLTMTFAGREVRGIYDEKEGTWITEHSGNGAFGPDSVELYTVYEDGRLTGLRLATKEEEDSIARDRKLSPDALKVELLVNSVRYDGGNVYFTIPESEERWGIFFRGRVMTEDGMGMSVHYLEEESEKAEWIPRMTYSFAVADAAYEELTMDVRYGTAGDSFSLTQLLPEGGPLAQEPLPEGKAGIPEDAGWVWPVDGGKITNGFGERVIPGGGDAVKHNGTDIGGMEEGAPIYAAGKGTVKEAGFNAADGYFVRLDHGKGLETFYAHCRGVQVESGDAVELGQVIAAVGSTGMSTGPHLHFELLIDGAAVDPAAYLYEAR
ncbi:MAG: peptidoglycan DD-metalloendopeptidase family protein [Oscillibacter sp.]|nr:peptidoglycan DD-metalloendopeptidase family protein [Oscillibacter sp.]